MVATSAGRPTYANHQPVERSSGECSHERDHDRNRGAHVFLGYELGIEDRSQTRERRNREVELAHDERKGQPYGNDDGQRGIRENVRDVADRQEPGRRKPEVGDHSQGHDGNAERRKHFQDRAPSPFRGRARACRRGRY